MKFKPLRERYVLPPRSACLYNAAGGLKMGATIYCGTRSLLICAFSLVLLNIVCLLVTTEVVEPAESGVAPNIGSNSFLSEPLSLGYACSYDEEIMSNGKRFDDSCGRWRVALSFRGQFGKVPGRCNEHLDRFIHSLPHVDIYVHHWTGSEVDYIQGRYSPASFLKEESSVADSAEALF